MQRLYLLLEILSIELILLIGWGKRGGWINQPLSDLEGELAKKHGHLYYWMIKLGFYHQQLLYINKHFDKSQVLVIPFRDLKENPSKVCQTIFKRLDIDDT